MKTLHFFLFMILVAPLIYQCKAKVEDTPKTKSPKDLSGNWDYTDSAINIDNYAKDTSLYSNFSYHSKLVLSTATPDNYDDYTFTGGIFPLTNGNVTIHINPVNDSVEFFFKEKVFSQYFADPTYKGILNRSTKKITGIWEYTNGWLDNVKMEFHTSTTKGKFKMTQM